VGKKSPRLTQRKRTKWGEKKKQNHQSGADSGKRGRERWGVLGGGSRHRQNLNILENKNNGGNKTRAEDSNLKKASTGEEVATRSLGSVGEREQCPVKKCPWNTTEGKPAGN